MLLTEAGRPQPCCSLRGNVHLSSRIRLKYREVDKQQGYVELFTEIYF